MIEFIRGIVINKQSEMIVLETNGIGYQLLCSTSTIEKVKSTGEEQLLYTQLIVREDSMTLFGFATIEERKMFNKITSVSGIGAKTALAVLSAMNTSQLAIALVTEDIKSITKVKGIGAKTAKRMILELKEKVDQEELELGVKSTGDVAIAAGSGNIAGEAIQALMALGFSINGSQQSSIQGIRRYR